MTNTCLLLHVLAALTLVHASEAAALSNCDNKCNAFGRMNTCRERVEYEVSAHHKSRTDAINQINGQCNGQCSCSDSDFTPSPSPPAPPAPPAPPGPGPAPPPAPCGGPIPAKPSTPGGLNGVKWPTLCVAKTTGHFFGIGDWGGTGAIGDTWTNPGVAAHRRITNEDQHAQGNVANVMKKRAAKVDPDFVLNAGDNFYPGGYEGQCSNGNSASACADNDNTHQFTDRFSNMYSGPGLDGKPWLSVLGNHDYGGISFGTAWDAQIYRTWSPSSRGGRWVMPGQYWQTTIKYSNFEVDVFALDSNFLDAHPPGVDPNHNICQGGPCYGVAKEGCPGWMSGLWGGGKDMLRKGLAASTARWKIVVTHFPGPSIAGMLGEFAGQIDLLFTGHTHFQALGNSNGMEWIISGGGGGVSSDGGQPNPGGYDDAYGFVDFTISESELKIEMLSWGGWGADEIIRKSNTIRPKSLGFNKFNGTEDNKINTTVEVIV